MDCFDPVSCQKPKPITFDQEKITPKDGNCLSAQIAGLLFVAQISYNEILGH